MKHKSTKIQEDLRAYKDHKIALHQGITHQGARYLKKIVK